MGDLTAVDVLGGAVRAAGIVELEPTDRGIVLHRMPAWARAQHNDIALPMLETMPSGGRLEMVTDATTIELDVHLTLVQLGTEPGPPAAFDLVVDGELGGVESTRTGTLIVIDRYTGAVDIQRADPTTIRFDGLPARREARRGVAAQRGGRPPHRAARRRRRAAARGLSGARRWVHYGSSISHCLEATRPTGVWPVVAARLAGVDLQSFGLRRAVPARSVRRTDDRAAAGRPDQPQARHQHRERRLDARAHLRPGRPRLPRPGARSPSRRPAGGGHADHLPGRRGPPRPDGGRRRRAVLGDRAPRRPGARGPHPPTDPGAGGRDRGRPAGRG